MGISRQASKTQRTRRKLKVDHMAAIPEVFFRKFVPKLERSIGAGG
jgi:hypothetical protein